MSKHFFPNQKLVTLSRYKHIKTFVKIQTKNYYVFTNDKEKASPSDFPVYIE
jgi:hypothetical protein